MASVEQTDWWDEWLAVPEIPIGDLIDNFEAIAAQPIPYAALPARAATAYSAVLRCWADLQTATLSALLSYPKAGVGTLRSLIGAAREAAAASAHTPAGELSSIAAAQKVLEALPHRDRRMLSARLWSPQRLAQAALARELGVSTTWIYRYQHRAEARLHELLTTPPHLEVGRQARQLRRMLGAIAPERNVTAALADKGFQPHSDAADLILYLAGPYRPAADGWWENRSTPGWEGAHAALLDAFERTPVLAITVINDVLGAIGVCTDVVEDFMDSVPGLRRAGQRWVQWGPTLADKAHAVLQLRTPRSPATSEVIATCIGDGCRARRIAQTMSEDPRFVRASLRSWALREWGLAEYTGAFNEVTRRLDQSLDQRLPVHQLIADIRKTFPDVSEATLRKTLSSQAFVVERGHVRRRTTADTWRPVPAARNARGVFCTSCREIRVVLTVSQDLLRGSEHPLAPAVAKALGVDPGRRRRVSGCHDIVVRWRFSSSRGPSMGPLRPLAAHVNASAGDALLLTFDLDTIAVAVEKIPADCTATQLLATLVKPHPVSDARQALAEALQCRTDEVVQILNQRGDQAIAAALVTLCSDSAASS